MAEESKVDSEAEDTNQVPPVSKLLRSILKDVFPMRNTFTFRNRIVVSSDFDSGNLSFCEFCNNTDTHIDTLRCNSEITEESKEKEPSCTF